MTPEEKDIISFLDIDSNLKKIAGKVFANERITTDEAVELFLSGNPGLLAVLADTVKKRFTGNKVFFNHNFHIEPTNICINHCKFCSYRRNKGQKGAWDLSIDEIVKEVTAHSTTGANEVHIVGGVYPGRDVYYYAEMLRAVKLKEPRLHIKAFTAVEIDYMCKTAGVSIREGLKKLKEAGLESMPGGGAEIFDETLREKICPEKTSSEKWLEIHAEAHEMGIPTNATMLYGLLEDYSHRADHLNRLRKLQDKTGGFNAFIPLKFRHANNAFSKIRETTLIEDLKNYAVSRIFLDNIPHLKAYWPMIGKQAARLSLEFGVDDLDGTIDNSTRIYTMAGSEERPSASRGELIQMIREMNRIPVERDSLYNVLATF
jgi:aminodeoxyfutalosine synthase